MKINPIGVQTYQRTAQREHQPVVAADESRRSKPTSVKLVPQDLPASSHLAVQAPQKSYAEFLTSEERAALDILFTRLADKSQSGPAFRTGSGQVDAEQAVGRVIDVKV